MLEDRKLARHCMNYKIIYSKKTSNYFLPTTSYLGRGVIEKLPEIVKKKHSKNILLVIGNSSQKNTVVQNVLKEIEKNTKLIVYPNAIHKSDYETIDTLTTFCRKNNIDLIVAIGGGAILDSAKCAAILATHKGKVKDYIELKTKKIEKKGVLFVALPTTSGTGSEVTPWATVWADNKKKYSLTDKKMFADIAIVDAQLTDSLPAQVTAESGIDALCQAVESYWNVNHNPTSDKYALRAIELLIKNLNNAVNKPSQKSRDNMSYGSLLGGLAFSNTQTTICHAVSYPMTAHWGIPHGQATSITLPLFINYTLPVLPKKRQEQLLQALGVSSVASASKKITKLIAAIHLKTKLSELGIKKKDIRLIVTEGFHPDRAKNAPRIPTSEELQQMLEIIY